MKLFTQLAIIFILLLSSCESTNDYVKKHSWKYGEGYHVGDWLSLDSTLYELKHDTIFDNKIPVAIIIKTIRPFIANNNRMIIRSLQTTEEGLYFEK